MVRSLMVNEISAMVVCDHEKKGTANWYQDMQQRCARRRGLPALPAVSCPTMPYCVPHCAPLCSASA
jgi:hypothetical protein